RTWWRCCGPAPDGPRRAPASARRRASRAPTLPGHRRVGSSPSCGRLRGVPVLALGASDCEALRVGWLAQPANTVSSLAYVVAAAAVLWRGGPRVPAVALGIVGLGSVLYHGPMSPGAETVHGGSILAMLAVGAVAWKRGALPRPPVAALAALGAGVAVN